MPMKSLLLLMALLMVLAPLQGFADFCEERAAAGLAELEPALRADDADARIAARDVLVRVCRAGQGAPGAAPARPAATSDAPRDTADARQGAARAPAEAPVSESQGTRLLGIEFRRAAADAPGQDRARKRP